MTPGDPGAHGELALLVGGVGAVGLGITAGLSRAAAETLANIGESILERVFHSPIKINRNAVALTIGVASVGYVVANYERILDAVDPRQPNDKNAPFE